MLWKVSVQKPTPSRRADPKLYRRVFVVEAASREAAIKRLFTDREALGGTTSEVVDVQQVPGSVVTLHP